MSAVDKINYVILVVDDDIIWQETLSNYFKRRGFNVLVAADVHEAKDILAAHQIDVAILDSNLGKGGNGKDVGEHIVEDIWPRQEKAEMDKTAIVTFSGDFYHVKGESAAYSKLWALDFVREFAGGSLAWIKEMKAKVPGQRSSRPADAPDVNSGLDHYRIK